MRCGDHEDDLFIAEDLMDISQIRDNKIGQLKNKTHKSDRVVWALFGMAVCGSSDQLFVSLYLLFECDRGVWCGILSHMECDERDLNRQYNIHY